MQLDPTTLSDLAIFKGEHNIFNLLNNCVSHIGRGYLKSFIKEPSNDYQQLIYQQEAVKFWLDAHQEWPKIISNGTLVMVEKFFETNESYTYKPGTFLMGMDVVMQKIFNKNAYSFALFSIKHLQDFYIGCNELIQISNECNATFLLREIEILKQGLENPLVEKIIKSNHQSTQHILSLAYQARRTLKNTTVLMLQAFGKIDAWHSMAVATKKLGWNMPQILPAEDVCFECVAMFHPLIANPKSYSIKMDSEKNFIFLTGANMSGKSTFIRTIGTVALLAHLGMGVPAKSLKISFLEGIITNMQVEDNIIKGESYFFAEVQRMKITAHKIIEKKHLLVLMDELFKGTNVHDAYECSKAVIDGLLHHNHNLMALSTHLNELSNSLDNTKILFRYFNTELINNEKYVFTYELKVGVSKDRIGYIVLKNEGVLDILNKGNLPN